MGRLMSVDMIFSQSQMDVSTTDSRWQFLVLYLTLSVMAVLDLLEGKKGNAVLMMLFLSPHGSNTIV